MLLSTAAAGAVPWSHPPHGAAGEGYAAAGAEATTAAAAVEAAAAAAAPGPVDLDAASDTGASNSDDLTTFNNGAPAAALRFLVAGTVAGATVKVYAGSVLIGSATASGTSTAVTTNGTTRLGDGVEAITATQTVPGEAESAPSAPLSVTVDATAPAVSASGPTVHSGGGTSYHFTVTYTDAVAADVASIDGSDVQVSGPNGFSQPASLVAVNPAGNGSPRTATYRIAAPQGAWDLSDNGTYTVTVQPFQVRDTAGNFVPAGPAGTFTVAIPGVPFRPDLLAAADSGVSNVDDYTSFNNSSAAKALQFAVGNTVSGAVVTVYADGVAIGSAVASGTTTTVTTNGARTLVDGVRSITARQTGQDGKETADSPALSITVDTGVPTAPAALDLRASSDTGASTTDDVTSATAPVFDAPDVAPAGYYRVFRDGVLVSGAYATGPAYTSGTLAAGSYVFTLRAVDPAGNESPASVPLTVLVDPTNPSAALTAANVTSAGGDGYTFFVTYADNHAVDVSSLDGNDLRVTGPNGFNAPAALVSVDVAANGTPRTATYRITPPGGNWDAADNGTYNVALQASQARDVAGNAVPAGTLGTFTVAAGSLGAPDLLGASDSGLSNTDNVTNFNNATPARALSFLVVNTTPGATVGIYADGVLVGQAVASGASATVTTNGSAALADGVRAFTARQTPSGGTQSPPSPALAVTLDTAVSAPPAPVLRPTSDTGISNSDRLTAINSPTFDVTVTEAGVIHLDGVNPADGGVSLSVPGAGTHGVRFLPPHSFLPQRVTPVSTSTFPNVEAADVNLDGRTDVLVVSPETSPGVPSRIAVLLSRGDGTFDLARTLSITGSVYEVQFADFNNDGKPDFAVAADVYLGSGDGNFQKGPSLALGSLDTAVGDVNGDGNADVLLSQGGGAAGLAVHLGNGDGTFKPPRAELAGTGPDGLSLGDINGDGKLDVSGVGHNFNGSTFTSLGEGDGGFRQPVVVGFGGGQTTPGGLYDVDADGKLDLTIVHYNSPNAHVEVLWGNGDGTFPSSGADAPVPYYPNPNNLRVGDFNRDGLPDMAITAQSEPGLLTVVYGAGNRTFQPYTTLTTFNQAVGIDTGDFNGDGRLDLVGSGRESQAIGVFLGTQGPLPDGPHSLKAWFEDLAGNRSGDSPPTEITVDATAPSAKLAAPHVAAAGGTTHTFTVTYSDATAVNAASIGAGDVLVTGPGGYSQVATFVSLDATTNGSPRTATYRVTARGGSWDFADIGDYTVHVQPQQVSDTAGNHVPGRAIGFFNVSVANALGAPDLAAQHDTGVSNTDNVTSRNNTSPSRTLQFTVANTLPRATVNLYADGVLIGSAVAAGTTTVVETDGLTALADGVRSITARQTQRDGTLGPASPALAVTVDATAPAAPPAPHLRPSSDSGFSDSDNLTRENNLTFDVTPAPHFRLYAGGTLVSGNYSWGGSYTYGAGSLANGTYAFTQTSVDVAGNESAQSAPLAVTLDRVAPAASLSAANVTSAGGTSHTFTVTYTDLNGFDVTSLTPGHLVVTGPDGYNQQATLVSVDPPSNGSPRTATYRIPAHNGHWDAGDDGVYTVALPHSLVKDVAGNVVSGVLGTFRVTATTLGTPDLLAETDSGLSNSDDVTNFNNASASKAPRFRVVNVTPGATVSVYADGTLLGSAVVAAFETAVTVTANGSTVIPDGVRRITARQTVPGSPQSPDSNALSVTVDTVVSAPPRPVLLPASDTGASNSDGLTNDAAPAFNVTVSEPGVIRLGVDSPPAAGPAVRVNEPGTHVVALTPDTASFGPAAQSYTLPAGSMSVAMADLNGDGLPDLVTAVRQVSSWTGHVLLGQADGTFRRGATLPLPADVFRVFLGDVNGDGKADLFATSVPGDNAIHQYLGNGDGTFQAGRPIYGQGRLYDIDFADVNGDGKTDLVAANDSISRIEVLLGNGDGTYQPPRGPEHPYLQSAETVHVADFNVDGRPDFAAGTGWGIVTFLGNGDGTFTFQAVDQHSSRSTFYLAGGDVNGDGRLDLVSNDPAGREEGFSILLGNGDGTFRPRVLLDTPPGVRGLKLVDFDRDGDLDLLASGGAARNRGDGTFQLATGWTGPSNLDDFAVADFDHDGRTDIAGADGSALRIYPGTGGELPDGAHAVTAWLEDVAGNRSADSPSTPITVDTTPPAAQANAPAVMLPGATEYEFTVTYSDTNGVHASTLGDGDVIVTGPNGFSQPATFVSGTPAGEGSPRTATYRITPPGGAWDVGDNGTYTVTAQPGQVRDLAGNSAAGVAGTFVVNVPLPGDANRDGAVNGSDFAILGGNFGRTGRTWEQGDFNGDGTVNGSDFAILAANFGRSVTPASTVAQATTAAPSTPPTTPIVARHAPRAEAPPRPQRRRLDAEDERPG